MTGYGQVSRATQEKLSSSRIVKDLKLSWTSRTVRNVLLKNPIVNFSKMKRQPPLSKRPEIASLEFKKKL